MLKRLNPGDLRTQIIIKSLTTGLNANGYPVQTWTPIFGEGMSVGCKWVNVHGREVYEAERLNLREAATLTLRYTPLINVRCRIWRQEELLALSGEADEKTLAYDIISVDDIQNRHQWLEIKVKRATPA